MAYATVSDIEKRLGRIFDTAETESCSALLDDAAIIIDAYNAQATADSKELVSIRMVTRAMAVDDARVPMGATQGSMSALGYSQSFTIGSGGGTGELYIGKMEKKLLGLNGAIGSYSPTQELVQPVIPEV